MNRFFTSRYWLVGALFCLSIQSRAHTVWLEPLNGQLVIRFAEPDGNFEKSPGHLDSLSAPAAFTIVTNAPVAAASPKSTNHFVMVGASLTNAAGVESIFTVRASRKPHFYARWQPAQAGRGKPMLTFDLVPTGKPGEVRVYFRSQPLGGLKATLRTPDEKEQEIPVDPDGYIRFESKQSGLHLLTIPHYRKSIAGFHLGRSYEQTSHNTALTWVAP
jgi:hypothetical protein